MVKKDKEQEEREAQKKARREERLARERDRQRDLKEARGRSNAELRDQQLLDPTAGNTPLVVSEELGVLVGTRSLSYREARRKVSAYIKYNKLQKHPRSKSCVTLDAKLASVLGSKPGTEMDIQDLASWIKTQMTPDPVADAQRRILRESLRESAAQVRKDAAREQDARVSKAEDRRKEQDQQRREAAEAHRRRVEEEYSRLKGG